MNARPEMNMARERTADRQFILLFVLYLSAFLLLEQLFHPLAAADRTFTAYVAYRFWGLFSLPVAYHGAYLTISDFPMEITSECTALHYIAIFSAGVLAYRRHPITYRFYGLLLGITAIFLLNTIRLGVLGLVGHYARNLFELVHVYLWQGAFALFLLLGWWLWVSRNAHAFGRAKWAVLFATTASLLALGALDLLIGAYATVAAVVLNALDRVISLITGIAISAAHEGSVILTITPYGMLHNNLFYEAINLVVFAAIAAASAVSLPRKVLFKRAVFGSLLLCLQHLLFIMCYGIVLSLGTPLDRFTLFLWTARGFNMIAPAIIWLSAARVFPAPGRGNGPSSLPDAP